jgi:hypothetical protein
VPAVETTAKHQRGGDTAGPVFEIQTRLSPWEGIREGKILQAVYVRKDGSFPGRVIHSFKIYY